MVNSNNTVAKCLYTPSAAAPQKNNTKLCLWSGSDGTRTGVAMVIVEGLTYLYHAGSDKYVHPLGGSSSPSNDTDLVYCNGCRPGIAVVLASVEDDVKIVSIEFDTSQLSSSASDTISADTVIQNNTSTDQPMEATIRYQRSVSSSFTYSFSEKASFSMSSSTEVSVGLPTIGEAKASVTMTVGVEFGAEQTTATTTSTQIESKITVKPTVPKNSQLKVQITVQRKSGNVPFTMTLETSNGVTFTQKGIMKTEYFFEQKVIYT